MADPWNFKPDMLRFGWAFNIRPQMMLIQQPPLIPVFPLQVCFTMTNRSGAMSTIIFNN